MKKPIIVAGSLNMDFLVQTERLPLPGQTVGGWGFQMVPGGKGANQAYAAARLGGNVRMVGCVGEDIFGDRLKASLDSVGVNTSGIRQTSCEPSGVALISIEARGQNQIIVAAGANGRLTLADLKASTSGLNDGFILLQLESPIDTVQEAAAWARSRGITTILDPAPAQPLSERLLMNIDLLTPNESEALQLLGLEGNQIQLAEAAAISKALLARGPQIVILKLGERGAWLAGRERSLHFPARQVEAIDVTAAGDTFNGALTVALSEERSMEEAIRFANAAASLSVTRIGAQSSIPSRAEVDALLAP